jgi:hypothetical protein
MSVHLPRKRLPEPGTESFEDLTCLTLDLIRILQEAPTRYRAILTLVLKATEPVTDQELASQLKVSRGKVLRARSYLHQALAAEDDAFRPLD